MMEARLAKPEESETIIKWMSEQDPRSLYLMNKNTLTLAAVNGELRGAMAISAVFLIASIPMNPANRHRDTVMSLSELFKGVKALKEILDVKELYFVAMTEQIQKQAEMNGFEKIPYPVYRKKDA